MYVIICYKTPYITTIIPDYFSDTQYNIMGTI